MVTFTFHRHNFYIHTYLSIHLKLVGRKLIGKSLSGWLELKNDLEKILCVDKFSLWSTTGSYSPVRSLELFTNGCHRGDQSSIPWIRLPKPETKNDANFVIQKPSIGRLPVRKGVRIALKIPRNVSLHVGHLGVCDFNPLILVLSHLAHWITESLPAPRLSEHKMISLKRQWNLFYCAVFVLIIVIALTCCHPSCKELPVPYQDPPWWPSRGIPCSPDQGTSLSSVGEKAHIFHKFLVKKQINCMNLFQWQTVPSEWHWAGTQAGRRITLESISIIIENVKIIQYESYHLG